MASTRIMTYPKMTPEERHRNYLRRIYGGSAARHYHAELERQGGGCALCGRTLNPGKRRLCQDHHAPSGQLRGVLCIYCNQTLGRVKDSIEELSRLAEYLLYWQRQREPTKNRGKGGCYKRGSIWWIQYHCRGILYRESSMSETIEGARILLRWRLAAGPPLKEPKKELKAA